jgi:hypothetical protein
MGGGLSATPLGCMMKYVLIQILFSIMLSLSFFAQDILLSKDSLNFSINNTSPKYWAVDSLIIKNIGDKSLLIDSIYSQKKYGYRLETKYRDTLKHHYVYVPSDLLNISIQPNDSAKFIFYNPDLCPICSTADLKPFADIIRIHSNSFSSYTYLKASGFGLSSIKDGSKIIHQINLRQNYPNPFNPITTITYEITTATAVELNVFNLLGEKISTLVKGYKLAGRYNVSFSGSNIPSGIYFYKLVANKTIITKKMQLLK